MRVELRDFQLLALELDLLLRVLEALLRREPLLRERGRARQVRPGLRERDGRALDRRLRAQLLGLDHAEALDEPGLRAHVEESRRARHQRGHQRAVLHFVADLERDAQQAPCERGRDDVALAHARLAVLVDGLHERAARDGHHVHVDRRRQECPHQRTGAGRRQQQPQSARDPESVHRHSRVFRTATRSSVSMRRRTISALTQPAATIATVANA